MLWKLVMGNTTYELFAGKDETSNTTMTLKWGIPIVTSKVIFLLHCTGLAQLSFYASLVGTYNFTLCNHTAIKTDYQNILQSIITKELNKASNIKQHISNRCIKKTQAKLLGCIYHFTKTKFAATEIWNCTHTLLKEHCRDNSEVNGTQNQQWRRRKCKHSNGICVLLELRDMWHSYEAYDDTESEVNHY